jgi:PAS domain S-box-containing protein
MPTSPTSTGASPTRQGLGRRESDNLHRHLTRLLSQVQEGILCINRDWVVTFANDEAFRRSPITPADLQDKKTYWEIYPYLIGTPLETAYRSVMETGEPTKVEYYCKPIDTWVFVQVCPTDDGIALYYQDITDRKRAEALRDASVRQLNQVLEATTDAVVSLNRNWEFTFLNRRASELLRLQGDMIGKKISQQLTAVKLTGGYRYHAERAMNEGISSEFESFYPEPLNLWLSILVRPSDDGIVIFFRDITASRHTISTLKHQQDLLAVVQQTARVATWDIDMATGNVTFGDGSYPVFGHPLAEIPTLRSFTEIVLPEYVPIVSDLIQKTIETGEMIVVDIPLRAANGEIIWVENRGHAVKVDDVSTRLRGLSIDITDRKRDEDALITSEARYRILADLNPQAIWMGAPDGSLTYANQGLLDYLGFSPDDLEGERWLKAFHPDHREHVIETWKHCVSTGADYDLEARMIRASDGHARWFWVRAKPVRDDHGNILHWLGVNIDIDDRKTFAETLQLRQEETERQRAELETIYETAPVGLALFDPVEFRYIRVNTRQAETIGLPKDQIIGRTITEIAPLKGIRHLFERVAAGHPIKNHILEGELPSRPGERRSWNVSYSPINSSDGKVEAIAAVVLEITNQKKAEAALIQSEKLAAVGRLATSISHEINNPLEAITNLLYLIATTDNLPPDLSTYVQTAQSELSRVCQIATQTLRFHRQAVRATHVTAEDLVTAVLNLYQGRLSNSSIHVEATYETASTILCFENDIRQVLNNLIANAIDAMRQGGGRLIVRAHDITEHRINRKGIRITIADTGHGMPPAVRARIYEPFYTTKELNGTGLGLWISAGIVNRHQGRLTFRSTEHSIHHGTVFSLFLPYEEIHEEGR